MRSPKLSSLLVTLSLALAASACSSSSGSSVAPTDTTDAGDQDTAPAAPAYPPEPYGLLQHNVFPNISWQGYKDATGPLVTMQMSDYYDPDGSRGINGIYFIVAAQWCPPCNIEADHAGKIYLEAYKKRGGQYVSVIIEDKSQNPSTQATLDQWISAHKITFDMGFDPSQANTHLSNVLPDDPNVGLPHNYVIDPRTMAIQAITQGTDPAVWACDQYPPSAQLTSDGCCAAGKTAIPSVEGPIGCSTDYACVKGLVCLTTGETSPSHPLDIVMQRNGAPAFGSP